MLGFIVRSDNIALLVRAQYQCEYCHARLSDEIYEIDHIWQLQKGGDDVDGNIALTCRRCNLLKNKRIEWIDRLTGVSVDLFNPRTMNWSDHFRITDSEVLGSSACGRATAGLLFRDTPQYLPPDLGWGLISGVGRNSALYYFLNHLRYQRIRNNFTVLEKNLSHSNLEFDLTPEDSEVLGFSKQLLAIELYFTRCSQSDIEKGLLMSHQVVDSLPQDDRIRLEAMNSLSILYQQAATLAYAEGNSGKAHHFQKTAYDYHVAVNPERVEQLKMVKGWRLEPNDATAFLRSHAMKARFKEGVFGSRETQSLLAKLSDLDPFYNTAYYSYMTDVILSKPPFDSTTIELLYSALSTVLEINSYGTGRDLAKTITVRRRWWLLHALAEPIPDAQLLILDLNYWYRLSMFNEIRELGSMLSNLSLKSDSNSVKQLKNTFDLELTNQK